MRYEIYSKTGCDYCTRAKTLLSKKAIPFDSYMLGVDFTKEELLAKFPEAKSFPVVVRDGIFVGGYTQLERLIEVIG